MKQIFQLEEKDELVHHLDPHLGPVKRTQTKIKATDTHVISHGGEEFAISDDMTFWLPDDVADFFLSRPNWHEGGHPFYDGDLADQIDQAENEKDTRIAELEAQLADATAKAKKEVADKAAAEKAAAAGNGK